MSELHDAITATANEGDIDRWANDALVHLGVPAKWRNIFYGVVRDECRRAARSIVRTGGMGHVVRDAQAGSAQPAGADRTSWLDQRFYNGTEYVAFGLATVADHQGRIEFQKSLRNGITADIERHRDDIAQIEAACVACLAEIKEIAA